MRPEHLSDSDLSGYLDDDLSSDERKRVEIHVESCAQCRAALLDVMRDVRTYERFAAPVPASASVSAVRRASRSRWTWTAAIVAAAVVAMVLARAPVSEKPAATALRGTPAAPVEPSGRRAIVVVEPAENASVDASAARIIWRPSGADLYHVALLAETGEPLWTRETRDTAVVLPHRVVLARGRSYFWRVDGMANGIVASSGAHRFTVR